MKRVSFVPTHKEVVSQLSWQKGLPGARGVGWGQRPACLAAHHCAKTCFDQWRGSLPLTEFVPDAL